MLYMVEMNMRHDDRLDDWHRWYDGHISMLLNMPGFLGAQRFVCDTADVASPFLAVYWVQDADALSNATYRREAGPRSAAAWAPVLSDWKRNLLDGLDRLPEIEADGWLSIADATSGPPPLPSAHFAMLPRGLDQTIVQRAIRWGGVHDLRPTAAAFGPDWQARLFRPLGAFRYRDGGPAHG